MRKPFYKYGITARVLGNEYCRRQRRMLALKYIAKVKLPKLKSFK